MAEIRLQHLCKAFGEKQVLRNFSAAIPLGASTALMGPSGSGKTTLARILMGLETPDAGVVSGTGGLRFSCVFQEDRLCEEFSAIGNVQLVLPTARYAAVEPALAVLGLSPGEMRQPVSRLSGGERRRVALVRAVLAASDVLVLDEAFKGLDEASREVAFRFVREGLEGRTLLAITHDAAEARALGAGVIPVQKLSVENDLARL